MDETPQYNEPAHENTAAHHHKPVHPKESQDAWRFGAELIRTAVVVSILAYVIRLFILQPFVVEGSSMYPRFQTNDFLIVDKLSYRFSSPQRGDIIVFKYPYDLETNYVKRIIGLPGDTVKIDNGQVSVIDDAHPEGVTLDEPYLSNGNTTTLPVSSIKNEFSVPSDKYFVLGDNRHASSDSREWGFLPKEDVIGRVIVQAYPFNRASWVSHARYDVITTTQSSPTP
jgi:signal peptidase I